MIKDILLNIDDEFKEQNEIDECRLNYIQTLIDQDSSSDLGKSVIDNILKKI